MALIVSRVTPTSYKNKGCRQPGQPQLRRQGVELQPHAVAANKVHRARLS